MGNEILTESGIDTIKALPYSIPVKNQIDLMSHSWCALTPKRTVPIEYTYNDSRSGREEIVRITGSPEYGIATIHDHDLILFVISQWVEYKRNQLPISRRIVFTPYQFFIWMGKKPQGTAYARLRESLQRLKTTNIETTIQFEKSGKRKRYKQFSWISEWEVREVNGKIEGVEVVLAEWLFESIQEFHVLTLDKRYFEIHGSMERWIYLYARKAAGNKERYWVESFRSLYAKSSSQGAFKHYANTLRKMIEKNQLPGIQLTKQISRTGQEMLGMRRTDPQKGSDTANSNEMEKAEQLPLIEKSPIEEAWENVLEKLKAYLSEATVASWLKDLQLVSLEDGKLTYRAKSHLVRERVQSQFSGNIQRAWESLGYEISEIKVEAPTGKMA